jgi:hypothetical protein
MSGHRVEKVPGTGIGVIDMEFEGRFAASVLARSSPSLRWILSSNLGGAIPMPYFGDEGIITLKRSSLVR